MRFSVLGPLEVRDVEGRPVALSSRNQQVILAILLAHRGLTVSASTLIDALWGNAPPPTALGTVRSYVSRLRGVLGASLTTRADGWMLDIDPDDLDAAEFERALSTEDPDRLAALLGLWRGAAYAGLADLEVLRGEAARLDSCRYSMVVRLAEAQLARGRAVEAVATAERLTCDAPLDERGWAVLIQGLAAVGRSADGLRAFQRAAGVLADAGLEPSARLREAERAVLVGVPMGVPHHRRAPAGAPGELIGRDVELDELAALVADHAVVTVVGPGGVGKTRLAVELAERLASRHALGARVIELSRVDGRDSVGDAVLDGLGIVRGAGAAAEVFERLGESDLLVVLDNCEHVLDEVAALLRRTVRQGRALRVVATSRERLGVPGEQVWRLDPLDTSTAGAASQLFINRAAAAGAGRKTPPADELVQRIVERLDGLPLAIEMAAAQLDSMTSNELAGMLDERLTDLRSQSRAGEDRHRTLAAAVAWSEALLSEPERSVFAAFSVFAGPVDSRDITAVLGDAALVHVRRLVGRSLVTVDLRGERARYGMLETIKAYAGGLLTSSDEVALRLAHARHVLAVARLADAELDTDAEATAHQRLDGLFGELRAAHRWAREHESQLALDLTEALWWWSYTRARDECFVWADAARQRYFAGDEPLMLLAVASTRASYVGQLDDARQLAERVIANSEDPMAKLISWATITDVLTYQGNFDSALIATADMIAAASNAGACRFANYGWANAALSLIYSGRVDEVDPHLQAMRALDLGSTDRALADYVAGEASLDRDPANALRCFERSISRSDSVGARFISGVARVSAVSLRARHADPQAALQAFVALIEHWRRTGNDVHQLTTLRNLPTLLQRLDAAEACAAVLGVVESQAISPTFGEEADRLQAARTWACNELGVREFERVYGDNTADSFEQVVRNVLGYIAGLPGVRAGC